MIAEKRLFDTDEEFQFMLDPGSDSDLSGLRDDEDQDITMKNIAWIKEEQEKSNDGKKLAENSFIDESENEDEDEDEDDENQNQNEPMWCKNTPPSLYI